MEKCLSARFLGGTLVKTKFLSAWRPSLLEITVLKDVMSIVKINLVSLKKLKSRKIFEAWFMSFMYVGNVLTIGATILSS